MLDTLHTACSKANYMGCGVRDRDLSVSVAALHQTCILQTADEQHVKELPKQIVLAQPQKTQTC